VAGGEDDRRTQSRGKGFSRPDVRPRQTARAALGCVERLAVYAESRRAGGPDATHAARLYEEGRLVKCGVGGVVRARVWGGGGERRSSLYCLLGGRTRRHGRPAAGAQVRKGRQAARRKAAPPAAGAKGWLRVSMCQIASVSRRRRRSRSRPSSVPPRRHRHAPAPPRRRAQLIRRWAPPSCCSTATARSKSRAQTPSVGSPSTSGRPRTRAGYPRRLPNGSRCRRSRRA
jgi:hypothetical protein